MSSRLHVFDKYEVIRRIASGGMGDIFLARQVGAAGFNRLVVLKSLRPELAERDDFLAQFLNEARTAAKLNHPNVVAVYDVDEYRGIYFLAMEYIKGADLSALLGAAQSHGQRIPFRLAAAIVHDSALGLLHAHRAVDDSGAPLEILHRDVSAQNLMVRLDGITKVVDFGIALAKADQVGRTDRKVQGKLRYLAPEQLRGQPLDSRTDQYSLGIVLYELLTRRRPFAASSPREIFEKILAGHCPEVTEVEPDVPAALSAVVTKMMAGQPRHRYASLAEVAEALGPLRNQGPPVEPLLAQLVAALVGKDVHARTQNLTPEPVTISGLLDDAEIACDACGAKNPLRHRFCRDCGAALGSSPKVDRRGVAEPPVLMAQPGSRSSGLGAHLLAEAAGLRAILGTDTKNVVTLAGRFGPRPGASGNKRELDAERHRLLEAMARAAQDADALVSLSTADELSLVFGAAGPTRVNETWALGVAAQLTRALAEAGTLVGAFAVAEGKASVSGAGRVTAEGRVIDDARTLARRAFDAGLPGVFVADALAAKLQRRALLSSVRVDAKGERVAFQLTRYDGMADDGATPKSKLLGRREELALARARLGAALAGRPQTMVFASDPGLGKSRLLQALSELAVEKGFARIDVDGSAPELASEGAFLRRLTTRALEALEGPGAERPADKLALLGLHGAAERRLLSALGQGPSDVEQGSADHHLRDDAILIRTLRQIADLVPLCLLVDDLHLLPPSAIALFDQWERRAQGSRIAGFATIDRADAPAMGLQSEVSILAALEDDKLLALAATQLGAPLPQLAAQRLLEAADGSPALAIQIAIAMVELGGLSLVEGHLEARPSLATVELPDRLDELVGLRLQQLSKNARSFLKVAAALGNVFSTEVVLAALGIEDPAVVAECLGLRLLERANARGDVLGFREPQVRRTLLERSSAPDLVKIHTRLATIFERRTDPADPRARLAIARHLLAAGAGARAVEAAIRAAIDSPAASDLHGQAAKLIAESPGIAGELSPEAKSALVEEGLGHVERIDLGLAEALASALAPFVVDGLARLLLHRASVRRRLGRLDEAEDDVHRALGSHDLGPSLRAELDAMLGAILEAKGKLPEAAAAIARAVASVEGAPVHPHFYWQQSNALGRLYFKLGEHERARGLFDGAAQEAEAAGSALGRAQALTNLAALAGSEGRFVEGIEKLAAARALAEGDPVTLGRIAYNQGQLELARRDPAAAKTAFTEASEWARQVGWQEGLALAIDALRPL